MIHWEAMLLLFVFVVYAAATVSFSLRYWLCNNRLVAAGLLLLGVAFSLHSGLLLVRGIAAGRPQAGRLRRQGAHAAMHFRYAYAIFLSRDVSISGRIG